MSTWDRFRDRFAAFTALIVLGFTKCLKFHSLVMDLPVMLLVMLVMTVPALVRGKLSRIQGIALLCIYAAFCTIQFTM